MSRRVVELADLAVELARPQPPTAASRRRRERKNEPREPAVRLCTASRCPDHGRALALPNRYVCELCAVKLDARAAEIKANHARGSSGHRGPPRQ